MATTWSRARSLARRALGYQQRAFDWLKSFKTHLDINDPTTWIAKNLPVQSNRNSFDQYSVAHEKFMWDARMEPGVVGAFEKIWGTDKLLVSFDSLNVTFPRHPDTKLRNGWPHIDQSPMKRGLHCVQGMISLSGAGPEDGSLVVVPGPNRLHEEFLEFLGDNVGRTEWQINDWCGFGSDEIAWWWNKGVLPVKSTAEPGYLILWDSRTIHWGGRPTDDSKAITTGIYVSFGPAKEATEEVLAKKKRVFEEYGSTTHWAHEDIHQRPLLACLPDGSPDPSDRSEPLEKPEMGDRMKTLAGIMPYEYTPP